MKISYETLGLTGRLGNALFELASTVGIARKLHAEPRFNSGWIHRPYFSVPDQYFTDNFSDCIPATEFAEHIDERSRIYLQDVNLFKNSMDEIYSWLSPSEQCFDLLSQNKEFYELETPVLSVHVRRTDNVKDVGVPDKHNYYVLPTLDYYQRAINSFTDKASSVAIFSDDIKWCEQNLKADYYHHGVTRPKEHEKDFLTAPILDWIDLQLMTNCDHHVVTGSTYGIWGALLSGDKQAVYCRPVYGKKLDYIDETLLFPSTWQEMRL